MASCPNCGFDLSSDGTCSVCGYGKQSGGNTAVSVKSSRRTPIIVGAVALCALIAAGGVFFGVRAGRLKAASLASAQAGGTVASASSQSAAGAPESTASESAASSTNSVSASTKTPGNTPAPSSTDRSGPASATSNTKPVSYDPTRYEKNPLYHVAVGASPVSLRASKPIDLYSPAHQPAFDITKRTEFPPLTSETAYVDWMLAHTNQSKHMLEWRWQRAQIIVNIHLITHRRVLMAFLMTPREWFVRKYNLNKTYANTAIPIGFGQTISGPELVAHMTDSLDPQPNQRILEIGTGSGYQSAVLSELSNYVYTIEIVKPLAEETNSIYLSHTKAEPQYANIHRRLADGYYGWAKYAPFDKIIVTTGIDHIPPELLKELKPGGIMLIPIGPPTGQVVLKVKKTVDKNGDVHLTREDIYRGGHREIFVPFTATGGGTHNIGGSSSSK